jgi:hypothetical protein
VGFLGARAIAAALSASTGCSLTRLNLARNHVGDRGAVLLLDAVSRRGGRGGGGGLRPRARGRGLSGARDGLETGYLNDTLRALTLSLAEVRATWPLPPGYDPPLPRAGPGPGAAEGPAEEDDDAKRPPLRLRQRIWHEPTDLAVRVALCAVDARRARASRGSRGRPPLHADAMRLIFDFVREPVWRTIVFE